MLSLKGCIVTVDALKGNQGTLHADVSRFLDDPKAARRSARSASGARASSGKEPLFQKCRDRLAFRFCDPSRRTRAVDGGATRTTPQQRQNRRPKTAAASLSEALAPAPRRKMGRKSTSGASRSRHPKSHCGFWGDISPLPFNANSFVRHLPGVTP
jgi:hypothetical protein